MKKQFDEESAKVKLLLLGAGGRDGEAIGTAASSGSGLIPAVAFWAVTDVWLSA